MSQANAEERTTEILHPIADRGLLRAQPRIKILLPDIHRTAHRDQQIEIFQVWHTLAGIEFDSAPFIAVFAPQLPKRTRMLGSNVLENQNTHRCVSQIIRIWVNTTKERRLRDQAISLRAKRLAGKEYAALRGGSERLIAGDGTCEQRPQASSIQAAASNQVCARLT